MPAGAWLELDLLRRRRDQLGLEAPRPVPSRALLWRGGLFGGGLIALVLLACLVTVLLSRWLEQRETQLAPDAAKYDQNQARIASLGKDLQLLQKSNQSLADAIAGLRSGSAVLTEIGQVVPAGLQLVKLKVKSANLEIAGFAPQPMALDAVNAFVLQLERSPFFESDGVVLLKAVEVSTPPSSAQPTSAKAPPKPAPLLSFELTAPFAQDAQRLTRNRLLTLGSLGLAKRVALLRSEGLLK